MSSRLQRVLRSRRLALWLLGLTAAYAFVGTLVPKGAAEGAAWDAAHPPLAPLAGLLGMHQTNGGPVLWALGALLAVSTVVCAHERTGWGLRRLRSGGRVSASTLERLRMHPDFVLPVPSGEVNALEAAAGSMRSMRLRVVRGPRLLEAWAGRWSLFGSPLFHWSLALLLLVISLGQLSRSQGFIDIPSGSAKPDETSSYGLLEARPLYGRHTGLVISVPRIQLDFRDRYGKIHEFSPFVSLSDDSTILVSQYVHSNAPLRYGNLFVHATSLGLSPSVSLVSSSGAVLSRRDLLVRFKGAPPSGSSRERLELRNAAGGGEVVTVTVPLDRSGGRPVEEMPAEPRVTVEYVGPGGSPAERDLRVGEGLTFVDGTTVRLDALRYYTQLTVVDDWSIRPMYALFLLAGTGLLVSTLSPARNVWVLAEEETGVLNVLTWHARRDPAFAKDVEDALRRGLEAGQREMEA